MLHTIDPGKVRLLIGGVPISGFGDNISEIEYDEDAFTLKVGTDAHSTRVKNLNKNGKATVYLMQSSASNDVLDLLATKDRTNGTGVVPFLLTDLSGRTVASAPQCYVTKKPKVAYGKEVKENTWMITLIDLDVKVGGNS
jgi:hypothetical protein